MPFARSLTAGRHPRSATRILPLTSRSRRCSDVSERGAVAELLHALALVLDARGIRWYVFGAQAVMIWGRPRFSADVDVTAAIDPAGRDPFVDAMQRQGFQLRIEDEEFITRTRVLPFV